MPSEILSLAEFDYKAFFVALCVLMAGWVALNTLVVKFCDSTGIELPWKRKEKEQNEKISELRKHMTDIDADNKKMMCAIEKLEDMVTSLSTSVEKIDAKQDRLSEKQSASERARLKDRILQSYSYYKRQGHWTSHEREALLTLIESYRENGENNTFVNEKIAVEIEGFEIIDQY